MKRLTLFFVVCVCSTALFSQSITNTLGSSGSFIIKDGANTFLTLDQATGHLTLNSGAIFKGTDRFIHNYGTSNTFIGINSGNFTMTGLGNAALGTYSLFSNTTGNKNTALGVQSLLSNTEGSNNTALGYSSLSFNTTGVDNTASGFGSLYSNTTGYQNTALGVQSLFSNIDGYQNTAVGWYSLYSNTTGNNNIALGINSLYFNTTGTQNTAVGWYSLYSNITGDLNTAVGVNSLLDNTTGEYNTAVGFNALKNITTGGFNTGVGYDAEVPNAESNNQVRIGNTNVTYAGVQVPWTITSDKRWKSDIQNSNLALNFINKLRPVSYFRNNDEKHRTEYGFIAQEVEEVLKESGVENAGMITIDDKGRYELRYNDLLAPIVKAIQELKAENEQLRAQLEDVKEIKEQLSEIKTLKEELNEQIKLLKTNNKDADVKFSSLGKQ